MALILIAATATLGMVPYTAPTGDLDGDGSVDAVDVQCEVLVAARLFLVGAPDEDLCQSDGDCVALYGPGETCRPGLDDFLICLPGCLAPAVTVGADGAPSCPDPGADDDDCLGLTPKRVADLNCDGAINNVDLQFLVAVVMEKAGGAGTADVDGDGRLNFCDDDSDGDGVPDETDPAPLDPTIPEPVGPTCAGAASFLGLPDYDNYQIKLPIFDAETGAVSAELGPGAFGIGFNGGRATLDGTRAVVWGQGSSSTTYGYASVLDLTADPPVSLGGLSGGNPAQALRTVELLEDQSRCVVVSSNTQLDGGLTFLDLADGSVLAQFPRKQTQKGYHGVEIVPGGDHVVAWSTGNPGSSAFGYYLALDVSGDTITESGYFGPSSDYNTAWITDVVCAPDGATCVAAADELAVLSLPTLALEASFASTNWTQSFEAVAFSSDASRAVAMQGTSNTSGFGAWHILDMTQAPPTRIGVISGTEDSNLWPTEIHVPADSQYAVGVANHLAIIDLSDGSLAGTVASPGWQDDFIDGEMSPDGHYFIARTNTSYGGYFVVLDMTLEPPQKVGNTFGGSGGDYASVTTILMDPDSSRAYALGNQLLVIDLATASIIAEYPRPSSQDAYAGGALSCDGDAMMIYTPGSWSSSYGRYQLYDLSGELPLLSQTFGGSDKYLINIQGVIAAP